MINLIGAGDVTALRELAWIRKALDEILPILMICKGSQSILSMPCDQFILPSEKL
jgi:hypothetical protein